jgi:oxygen-dependent protoporphyrinogen oxidase
MGRVAVVGGGITGLAAAFELCTLAPGLDVILLEATDRLGGKIHTTPFAGLPGVDEGADAVLARVPWAVELFEALGLGDDLVAPATGAAAVWWDGALHPIPDGLVLGVPAGLGGLARSGLLSWRGKARAAIEPLLPRTDFSADALGPAIRRRFGGEVLERLVGPLVGSINAGDADRLSLAAATPQLAEVAARRRSLLIGLRRSGRAGPGDAPVFLAPREGMGIAVDRMAAALLDAGVDIRLGMPVASVAPGPGGGWQVDEDAVDAVILAAPAFATATLLAAVAPEAARLLGAIRYASVAIVTLAVPDGAWSRPFTASGFLVPKGAQRHVTACSVGSNKWRHWRRPGQAILRVSAGRAGDEHALDFDDAALVEAVIEDLEHQLGLNATPTTARVSRWPRSFPQYEPGHLPRVAAIEAALPSGLVVAGAAARGIGVPACVRQGRQAAHGALTLVTAQGRMAG